MVWWRRVEKVVRERKCDWINPGKLCRESSLEIIGRKVVGGTVG